MAYQKPVLIAERVFEYAHEDRIAVPADRRNGLVVSYRNIADHRTERRGGRTSLTGTELPVFIAAPYRPAPA
jgi:hypothetical protein